MTTTQYNNYIREIAETIYVHVVNEQIPSGSGQCIEPAYGLGGVNWIDARVDVATRETFDKGDYLTPDYLEVEYTDIRLLPNAAIMDEDGEDMTFSAEDTKNINRELARLCA